MNGTSFILVTAVILFVAFVLGWFASWLVHRLSRVTTNEITDLDRMAQELHEAEDARDEALNYVQGREQSLLNEIAQKDAELEAAMDGLRAARAEAEDLRAYIERQNQGE